LPKKHRKHVPLRSCIACRERVPKRELVRIVRTPEGTVEIDFKGKRSGRGAYLCRNQKCWEAALQPRRLSQALKCRVQDKDVAALRSLAASLIEEAVVESQTAPLEGVGAER
jgi:predicted RNA-binding protein YlxR (DUF448 family)